FRSPAPTATNYAITILGTTSSLSVTSVSLGSSQVRLTTSSPFFYGTSYVLAVYNVTGANLIPISPNPAAVGIGMTLSNTPPAFTNLMLVNQNGGWKDNIGNDWLGNPLRPAW